MPYELFQRFLRIAVDGDDDRYARALGDRKGSGVQRQQRIVRLVARALGEDADRGVLVPDDIDGAEDRFQCLPVVLPVDERIAHDVRIASGNRHVEDLGFADIDDLGSF